MGEVEPAKLLLPFLQRAKELQKHDPLVAYYCRLYAMERGLQIPAKERTKPTNALLVSLMNQLEKDKKTIKLSQDDHLYVEGFALNVFAKADKQDRAGHADLETAKTFYAASLFFEVLRQFGELQPDIEQKQKYSVWKAADIRKALSEGRSPEPGPPVGEEDLSGAEGLTSDIKVSLQKSELDTGAEVPHPDQGDVSTTYERMERSGSMKADVTSNMHELDASQSGRGMPFSYPDFSQSMSQPLHPMGHPNLGPAGDQSSYPTTYPAVQRLSHSSSSPQLESAPSTTENLYHVSSSIHETQAPPNLSYYSQQDLPSAPTHSPYPSSYVTQGTTYYPSPAQPSVPGVSNSISESSEYVSSMAFGVGYAGPLQHHGMPPASSMPAHFSNQESYQNYQPPPERIAEAHKASRYAVSALAFDDVPAAISYLQKSLELLTNPSATTH